MSGRQWGNPPWGGMPDGGSEGGGSTTFSALTDAFSITGNNLREVRVNKGATRLEAGFRSGVGLTSQSRPASQPIPDVIISRFQAGHGFTAVAGTASSDLNHTSQFYKGTQCAQAITSGAGGATAGVQKTGLSPIDVTSKYLSVTFKIGNLANLRDLTIRIFTGGGVTSYLRLQLDATQAQKPYVDNEWVNLVLPLGAAALSLNSDWTPVNSPDLTQVTGVAIRAVDDLSSGGAVTVYMQEIAFVPRRNEGVISITFDGTDGSVFDQAFSTMSSLGFRGTSYLTAESVGTAGKVTENQVRRMVDQGWDAGGLAYYDTTAAAGFTSLTPIEVAEECALLKNYLKSKFGRGNDLFAYPVGLFNSGGVDVRKTVAEFFECSRTLQNRWVEVWPPTDLSTLRVVTVTNSDSLAKIQERVNALYSVGCWVILVFNKIVVSGADASNKWLKSDFDSLCTGFFSQAKRVEPVSSVVAKLKAGAHELRIQDIVAPFGAVVAPASSTLNALSKFSDGTGKNLSASGVLVDNSNNASGIGNLALTGDITMAAGKKVGAVDVPALSTAFTALGSTYTTHASTTNAHGLTLALLVAGTPVANRFVQRNSSNDGFVYTALPSVIGNVSNSGGATINAVPRYSTTDGATIVGSPVLLSAAGDFSAIRNIALTGDISGGTVDSINVGAHAAAKNPHGLALTDLVPAATAALQVLRRNAANNGYEWNLPAGSSAPIVPRMFISGFKVSRTGSNQVTVGTGFCTDSSGAYWMSVPSSVVLATNSTTNFDNGVVAVANANYYLWVFGKTAGPIADTVIKASLSATAPTYPEGYDARRYIGSFRTRGSSFVIDFLQISDGNRRVVYWTEDFTTAPFIMLSAGASTTFASMTNNCLAPASAGLVYVLLSGSNSVLVGSVKGLGFTNAANGMVQVRGAAMSQAQVPVIPYFGSSDVILQYKISGSASTLTAYAIGYEEYL